VNQVEIAEEEQREGLLKKLGKLRLTELERVASELLRR
jgi:hypothetical protein